MKKQWFATGSLAAALAIFSTFAFAQSPIPAAWSGSAASNLVVSNAPDDQIQPLIAPAPGGGVWISWFDHNNSDGYDVRIQRLDVLGNKMFDQNGILVATRPNIPSTIDYDLSVDKDGNALLVFRLMHADHTTEIEAQKVSPDGELLWGTDGIRLGHGANQDAITNVAITPTSDEDIVVGWSQDGNLMFARLASDGQALWDHPVTISDPGGATLWMGGLHSSDDGSVIASYVRFLSFTSHHTLHLRKQDADGATLWAVTVFGGGKRSMPTGYLPDFTPDGAGGAVLTWYSNAPGKHSYVQHVLSDGSGAFAHNGVLVSTDTQYTQATPALAYDPDTQNIFVFWKEVISTPQEPVGIYGQRISASGERAWGDSGIAVVPLADMYDYLLSAVVVRDDSVVLSYLAWSANAYLDQIIHATRLNVDGQFVWSPSTVEVSTNIPANKIGLASARATNGMVVLTWASTAAQGSSDILAQNVNIDGRLGNHTPVASDASLTITANIITHGTLKASSPDGAQLVYNIVAEPGHGTVTLDNPNSGNYTYVPDVNYSGNDSFTFLASNGAIDSNVATVDITIRPPPDDDGGGSLGWLALAALLGLLFIGVYNRK